MQSQMNVEYDAFFPLKHQTEGSVYSSPFYINEDRRWDKFDTINKLMSAVECIKSCEILY